MLIPEVQSEDAGSDTNPSTVGEGEWLVGTPRLEPKHTLRLAGIFEYTPTPAQPAVQGKYRRFQQGVGRQIP